MPTSFRPTIVDRSSTPVRGGGPALQSISTGPPSTTGTSPTPFGGSTPPPSTDLIIPPPVNETTPQVDVPGPGSDFQTLNASALEAALAAIEAQFGLTRSQLMADRSAVGQEYQLLAAQAERARQQALEEVGFSAQERGITRSGIHAENVADTELAFAEQAASLEASRTSQQEAIDVQLQALIQQEELARLQAEQEAAMRLLDQEVLQALMEAGL